MTTFYKAHGLGNDFIVFCDADVATANLTTLAMTLCDRHRGIGGDGLLLLGVGQNPADVSMRVLNSDGSEPEMCGNGIRCAVKVCVEKLGITSNPVRVSTRAGLMTCAWGPSTGHSVQWVSVDMGEAIVGPHIAQVTSIINTDTALAVDIGNPHVALFGEFSLETICQLGPRIQALPVFPKGVNVNFATMVSVAPDTDATEIQLTVFERGAGLTLACGTGACATTAAAAYKKWLPLGKPITVTLPGGNLFIEVNQTDRSPDNRFRVTMTGPAEIVYQGTVEDSFLMV
ncbi:MAG: diaminopimelate epimerase [Myxococcales bacterium]|nr:diaminopimelate epimerase [Myxococcales bacterium]